MMWVSGVYIVDGSPSQGEGTGRGRGRGLYLPASECGICCVAVKYKVLHLTRETPAS
jgi:hypothetical protein